MSRHTTAPRRDAAGHPHAHEHSDGLVADSIERSLARVRATAVALLVLGLTAAW